MKITYSSNPDFYKFSNNHKSEFIFFKWGIVISNTSKTFQDIEKYNVELDKVEQVKGFLRVSKFYNLTKKFPFIKEDSILTQTILEV